MVAGQDGETFPFGLPNILSDFPVDVGANRKTA
jgi:hypothetical protein